MIPVVMLGINTGGLSSPLTLFFLTATSPSFEHNPVIYLMTLTMRAILLFFLGGIQVYFPLAYMMSIVQLANLAFSLLINIFATSIIAIKAWCVRVDGVFGKDFVDLP